MLSFRAVAHRFNSLEAKQARLIKGARNAHKSVRASGRKCCEEACIAAAKAKRLRRLAKEQAQETAPIQGLETDRMDGI